MSEPPPSLPPPPPAALPGGRGFWLSGWESFSDATPLSSLHNCRADAAREAAAQTQVAPPATSSLILHRPTITFGPETICWAKGEEGLEGKEEEREEEGGSGLKWPLKSASIL